MNYAHSWNIHKWRPRKCGYRGVILSHGICSSLSVLSKGIDWSPLLGHMHTAYWLYKFWMVCLFFFLQCHNVYCCITYRLSVVLMALFHLAGKFKGTIACACAHTIRFLKEPQCLVILILCDVLDLVTREDMHCLICASVHPMHPALSTIIVRAIDRSRNWMRDLWIL